MKQYKVTPGFLVEMPRMEKPDKEKYRLKPGSKEYQEDMSGSKPSWQSILWSNYEDAKKRYEEHIASLARIPIATNVSFEGEIINEDQFEMREVFHHDSPRRKVSYAYPKQPEGKEKGEVELNSPDTVKDLMALVRYGWNAAATEIFDYCNANKVSQAFTDKLIEMLDESKKRDFSYERFKEEYDKLLVESSSPQPQPTQEEMWDIIQECILGGFSIPYLKQHYTIQKKNP